MESRLDGVSQAELERLFQYDEKTGFLTWRVSRGKVKAGTRAGCLNDKGYLVVRIRGKLYNVHRLIWQMFHGEIPYIVDHINHIRHDNRIQNLRAVTASENNANLDMRSDNKSGFKGVSKHKASGKWVAKLRGKTLGYFDSPEQAARSYQTAARQQFGVHFNDTSGQKDRRRY